MEKTAMEQLIEHMEYFKAHSAFARDTIKKATELLETEKKQMVVMYDKGYSDATSEAIKEIHENYSPNK
jgi:hypothetical protein